MKIQQIKIKDLDFESLNIRSSKKYSVEDPALHSLAYSISRFGLRNPICVYLSEDGSKYKIFHGKRRASSIYLIQSLNELNYVIDDKPFKITKEIKKKHLTIPCVVYPRPENEKERILNQIAENSNRKDVDNLELSEQYNILLNQLGIKQFELAKLLGKTQQAVSDIIRLKAINPSIKKLIEEIQLFSYSVKKLEEEPYNEMYSKNKNIGIQSLRRIADAGEEQAKIFWHQFCNRCTYEDAESIGLTREEAEKIEKDKEKDNFSLIITNYSKILKQYKKATGTDKKKLETKRAISTKELAKELMKDKVFKKVVSEFILV